MADVQELAENMTENCLLKKSKEITDTKIDTDDEDWVQIQMDDEDKVLKYCWANLPLEISFEEFKKKMLALKEEKQNKPSSGMIIRWTQYTIWFFHSLWVVSGYASTLFTVAKYREIIVQLLYWFLFHG